MTKTFIPRACGILLHPTSLPSQFGIGDLGPSAYRWIETLASMGQTWWQVLPLGPPGAGNSPYHSYSAFAGNTLLLSPELLAKDGLISEKNLSFHCDSTHIDYQTANSFKRSIVNEAWTNYSTGNAKFLTDEYESFIHHESYWLDDYAIYMTILDHLGNDSFTSWPKSLLYRDKSAIQTIRYELADSISKHRFGQFLFDRQWNALKEYAVKCGIKILGDIPIFISPDSADIWAHPELFLLDSELKPVEVAGVPPDYFSSEGQLWGNPLYNWEVHESSNYDWWVKRLMRLLSLVDYVRLDHFRGYVQSWHIPAGEKTARSGRWVDGPGKRFFLALREQLGCLPFIAEDLGHITQDVITLREELSLPGMRVLQFALNGPSDIHWPHNYEPNIVCYTGTHDNETVNGWWAGLSEHSRHYLGITLGHYINEPAWDLIRMAWSSVATLAIAPMQDVLGLGNEARMNRPGTATGNWRWRFNFHQLCQNHIERLREFTYIYNRLSHNLS